MANRKAIQQSDKAMKILMNGGTFDDLRPCKEVYGNATLRRDEWERIDDALMQAARQNLVGIQDLRDQGLSDDGIDIGITLSTIERTDQGLDAEKSMSGDAPATEGKLNIDELSFAIPFYQAGFRFSMRALMSARRRGEPLDATSAREAAREVTDLLEDDLFNGGSISYRGGSIPGYTTESNRNTVTGSDWGTNTNVIPDVNSADENLTTAGYGNNPKVLYVSNTQYHQMRDPFTDQPGVSPLDVLEDREDMLAVRKSGKLTDEAVLVAMVPNVVDLMIAEDLNNVEWEDPSGTYTNFRSVFVGAPRVKSDQSGNSGIAHITGI